MPFSTGSSVYTYRDQVGNLKLVTVPMSSGNTSPARSISESPTVGSLVEKTEVAQSYFLDRGNGQVTRLIPADTVSLLNEIPAREEARSGMMILPPLATGDVSASQKLFTAKHQRDALQVFAPHNNANALKGTDGRLNQKQIDHIVFDTPTSRRAKIFCDKWIHEGVCAFTQQGCKFKHEMPHDEATQRSLGLFHGLPSWWKRQSGEEPAHQGNNPVEKTPIMELDTASVGSAQTPSPKSPVIDRTLASSGSQWIQNGIVPFSRGPMSGSNRYTPTLKSWITAPPGFQQQFNYASPKGGSSWRISPPGL